MIDSYNKITGATGIIPAAAKTATGTYVAVDTLLNNGCNSVCFLIVNGVITDGTHTFKLQDSPDNSTWTDVPALYVQNAGLALTSATTSGTVSKIGYLGNTNGGYRYVRLATTVAGATSGGFYAAVAVLGHAALLPAV